MPKPTRDYPLLLKNEIVKIDAKIANLQADRSRLLNAYDAFMEQEKVSDARTPPQIASKKG